jgi:hypothetical protein
MKEYLKWIIGFGILVWLIPFFVSFPIVGLRETNRVLFESIMPVVLTITIVLFSILFFTRVKKEYFKEGIIAGISWFCISLFIDLLLFLPESPMQMSLPDYMMDIGLTYLMLLIIPVGFGYILDRKTDKL